MWEPGPAPPLRIDKSDLSKHNVTGLIDAASTRLIHHLLLLLLLRSGSVSPPAGASGGYRKYQPAHRGTSSPDAEQQQHRAATLDADALVR